jgi:hypothetical protein
LTVIPIWGEWRREAHRDAYSRLELCMPIWLNHDYEDGGVVDILAVDAYFGVDVRTPIFMGEVSN